MREQIPATTRQRIRNQGGRRALRAAMFNIEKLGIEHDDWCRVKSCIEGMISDLDEPSSNRN